MSPRHVQVLRAAPAALVICALFAAARAGAQISVSVAPPFIEQVARPGSSIRDIVTFRNGGSTPLNVSVTFTDFAVSETGEPSERPPGTDASSILPYIRINPLRTRVAPNQEVRFRYTVRLPSKFTQLRAMLMFAGEPDLTAGGNQVVFTPRLGVPLYVESTAALPPHLEVSEVEWKRSGSGDNLLLSMLVRNSGDRNIRPTGTVSVRSPDGFQRTFPFNEGRDPVLPGQKRRWQLPFGPVPGGVDLSVSLRFATSFADTFSGDYRVPAASR